VGGIIIMIISVEGVSSQSPLLALETPKDQRD
jgi:hypothetical protein